MTSHGTCHVCGKVTPCFSVPRNVWFCEAHAVSGDRVFFKMAVDAFCNSIDSKLLDVLSTDRYRLDKNSPAERIAKKLKKRAEKRNPKPKLYYRKKRDDNAD